MSKLNPVLGAILALAAAVGCRAEIGDDPFDRPGDPDGMTGAGKPGSSGGVPGGPGIPGGPGSGSGGPADCYPVPTRIWKLSDSQYTRAITDLLPSVKLQPVQTPGLSLYAFANIADELPVSGSMATVYRQTAKDAAAQAVTNINSLITCKSGEAQDACAGRFIDELAPRAWRRLLTAEDRAALLGVYQVGSADGFATGIRMVLEAIFQSPSFLYRTELGTPAAAGTKVSLTPYELASSLSFLLLDSVPDEQLWAHAKDGTIADDAVWKQEADRLLKLPRVQDNLVQVLVRWLAAEQVLTAEDYTMSIPNFEMLRESMLQETRRFLSGLISGAGTVSDLLTSKSTQISPELAPLYGVTVNGTGVQPVMLAPTQRSGILTQLGIIAGWAKENRSVHRGLFVFRELLCGEVPSPPVGTDTSLPAGIMTEREFVAYRAANTCSGCHSHFDPIGMSYENYDPIGRYITQRDGAPVEPKGAVTVDGAVKTFANVVELGTLLAQSQEVKACIAQKLTVYSFGRRASDGDVCISAQVEKTTTPTGSKLLDFFKSLTESAAFRNRIASN